MTTGWMIALLTLLLVGTRLLGRTRVRRPAAAATSARTTFGHEDGDVPTSAASPPSPPPSWDWSDVDDESASRRGILAGQYTSVAVDQHRSGWCGACYIVSVVQMIEDRWNVLLNAEIFKTDATRRAAPYASLDLLVMMREYDHVKTKDASTASWNGCQGGSPADVLDRLIRGDSHVREADERGQVWTGFVGGGASLGSASNVAGIQVVDRCYVPNDVVEVKREIYDRGSVVLLIDAECLLKTDERGVAESSKGAKAPNHAVTVLGWRRVPGTGECWLVRNSWGALVPDNLPPRKGCVGRRRNECVTKAKVWHSLPGRPGMCLLPFVHLQGKYSYGTSPWVACQIQVRDPTL